LSCYWLADGPILRGSAAFLAQMKMREEVPAAERVEEEEERIGAHAHV
jgi:hypothetical protein